MKEETITLKQRKIFGKNLSKLFDFSVENAETLIVFDKSNTAKRCDDFSRSKGENRKYMR